MLTLRKYRGPSRLVLNTSERDPDSPRYSLPAEYSDGAEYSTCCTAVGTYSYADRTGERPFIGRERRSGLILLVIHLERLSPPIKGSTV